MLSLLPPEIWRVIIQFSVEIPGSFETKWDHLPDSLLWHGWELPYYYIPESARNRGYYSALKTKVSIAQVSRAWREIGREMLYEYLLFVDGDEDDEYPFQRIAMVAAIFERHTHESGYGRITKRIDVLVTALCPATFPTLMRLLTLCHNLRILTIYKHEAFCRPECNITGLSSLASLLQTRFGHSLRRLAFNVYDEDMRDRPDLGALIQLPNLPLASLELGADLSRLAASPSIATVSALTIQTAYISLLYMVSWHCPALRHLTLVDVTDECVLESRLPFLISHGPQLFSLALFSLTPGKHNRRLSRLIAPATNLRCLVFDFLDAQDLSEKDIFPTVTHIGIRIHKLLYFRLDFHSDQFFTTSIFPKLHCLRFLDISNERPGWLLDIARKFNHARVENKDCQLIL